MAKLPYLTPEWPNEVLICAIQYACPEEEIGFRYENPILIHTDHCEEMSKFKLSVDEIL